MVNKLASASRPLMSVAALATVLGLAACSHNGTSGKTVLATPSRGFLSQQDPGGFNLFGGGPRRVNGNTSASINVNGFLWRATLDTLSFMPLSSADPYGGLVITDWYSNPEKPDERFKATVYILDSRLRADGLNVSLFKQVRDGSGQWVDAPVTPQTETDVENAILTRARQLRISNSSGRG